MPVGLTTAMLQIALQHPGRFVHHGRPMRLVIASWLLVAAVACSIGAASPLAASAARADNGVSSMTPAQILAQVKKDVAGAKSVHVFGSGTTGGQKIALDLKLVKDRGGAGHLAEGGVAFDIIRIGPTAYFRGDQKFWSHFTKSSGLAQLFAGKWLSASATKGDLASFTPLTDISALTNQILASPGALEKGPTTTVNGKPAVEVIEKTGGGVLYIATSGPAYPLLIKPGKGGTGEINFGDWNKPVALAKPAKSIAYH